jgi:hypothetical protein
MESIDNNATVVPIEEQFVPNSMIPHRLANELGIVLQQLLLAAPEETPIDKMPEPEIVPDAVPLEEISEIINEIEEEEAIQEEETITHHKSPQAAFVKKAKEKQQREKRLRAKRGQKQRTLQRKRAKGK